MSNKLSGESIVLRLSDHASKAAGGNGTGVSLKQGGGICQRSMIIVDVSAKTGTTLDLHVEESDALATGYTDVAGGAIPTITATGLYALHLGPTKPFLRLVHALDAAFVFGAIVVGLQPTHGGLPSVPAA